MAVVTSESPQWDVYVAAFVARCGVARPCGQAVVESPGVFGLLPTTEHPVIRLLVTDDRAHDVLAAVVPAVRAGTITVFAQAERCTELVGRLVAWSSDSTTALVHRELESVSAVELPSELSFRAVRRLRSDPPGVPLEAAAAAAIRADPRIEGPPEAFVSYLRSLPPATRLFAAVDADGVVRATSGCVVTGSVASVMFVNTDREWRGRGIGSAMTAAALRVAQELGARKACLDATDAGLSIYQRLGFEAVTATTRFSCVEAS